MEGVLIVLLIDYTNRLGNVYQKFFIWKEFGPEIVTGMTYDEDFQ